MIKNIFKIIGIFVIGIGGGVFASQVVEPYFFPYQYYPEDQPVYLTQTKEIYIQENEALSESFEKVEKAVAGVRTTTATGKILEGSGLIVTSDGLMVTLAELVPFNSSYSFFAEGKQVSYQILKRDMTENLALVKISDSVLTTASFSRSEELKVGERVFLVGNIFPEGAPSAVVNEGIVRSIGEDFILTSIIDSAWLSGSPLFNIKGEVVGLSIVDSEGRIKAIPVAKIREFAGI